VRIRSRREDNRSTTTQEEGNARRPTGHSGKKLDPTTSLVVEKRMTGDVDEKTHLFERPKSLTITCTVETKLYNLS
jgi:hypothetical protein